jgi:DNA (cytosine-5)-methyltransferase 1
MRQNNPAQASIRFIDLFAGIGGFHVAFANLDCKCVFASEWDEKARLTYWSNFRKDEPELFGLDHRFSDGRFAGDITEVTRNRKSILARVPKFDVLCAGFPCQPFSNAGLRKGFEENRGTLFWNILDILEARKPAAYFLENVRGLDSHMSGDKKTIEIIENELNKLGYSFQKIYVKASDHGLPQHRPRLFMIGFKSQTRARKFRRLAESLEPKPLKKTMSKILGGHVARDIGLTLRVGGRGSGVHDRRNWDCYLVDGVQVQLEPKHALEMQGFPKKFTFPADVSKTQAMKQARNSVAVAAVEDYARLIIQALD